VVTISTFCRPRFRVRFGSTGTRHLADAGQRGRLSRPLAQAGRQPLTPAGGPSLRAGGGPYAVVPGRARIRVAAHGASWNPGPPGMEPAPDIHVPGHGAATKQRFYASTDNCAADRMSPRRVSRLAGEFKCGGTCWCPCSGPSSEPGLWVRSRRPRELRRRPEPILLHRA